MEILFWFVSASIFIFGLIIGSFLNCLIWRSYTGESALSGRSYCPKCRRKLAWLDLLPVFSFLILGGKCRYCRQSISWQYPAVELATAVLFCAGARMFAPMIFLGHFPIFRVLELLAYWVILAAIVAVFVADLRWYFIPDGAVVSGLVGALALRGLQSAENYSIFHRFDAGAVVDPLLASIFAGLFFLAIFLASRGKWMGFGDVKYAFLMGLILGFIDTLIGLFLANFFGAIMGLALIAAGRKKMSSQIPFGPFLAAGTLIALFFSPLIVNWYLSAGI